MELLRTFVVFYLGFSNTESVFLNSKGQYENLVITIEPGVRNLTFLYNTEEVMSRFSSFLCSKTEKRFMIKSVTVVLPPNYIDETLDKKTVHLDDETLPKEASIVVGSSGDSYQEPTLETLHLGGCGQQGEYIRISPGMFGVLQPFNRTLAHLLMHEWAHYRWGLFDEYGVGGEDMDSPFYLTANKMIKPIACPANLTGWMLTSDLKPCGRNNNLLPQPGCHFHIYYRKNYEPPSSLLMGYAVNKKDEFCGGSSKIEHNPSPLSPHNLKCQHKSAFEILNNHPDFKKTPKNNKAFNCSETPKVTFFKRNILVNMKKIIVILDHQFEDPQTSQKIKSALKLVNKYAALSNFTLITEDTDANNFTAVVTKHSPLNAPTANKDISVWVVTGETKSISKSSGSSGVNFLVPERIKEEWEPHLKEKIIKAFPEKLSMIEIANSFIEHVVKRSIPDDKIPGQIYKHLFTNGDVRGSFILDSSCGEALFIASEVNVSNGNTTLTGSLSGPNGELCPTSLKQSSPCSNMESDGTSLSLKINDGSWTRAKWSYEVNVKSYDSISVIVICRLLKKSLQVIPRLLTKSLENTGVYNASVKNNIVVLAASVMYDANPVLKASVYVDIDSEHEIEEGNRSILLYDDGIGSDVTRNDGIYTNEFLNFKGNGHYSFSFGVNINGSSEVLNHHQFLKMDDKVVGVGRNMNFPTFLIRDNSTLENLTKMYGEPKSEFSYKDLVTPIDETPKASRQRRHIEDQERKSEPLSLEVIDFNTDFHDLNDPGQVTDLKVSDMSYKSSFVTLEWTSVGDDGFSGTAERIDIKFTTDGNEFPLQFHEPGSYMSVNDANLMEGSLKPQSSRTKHTVSIKVPLKEGSSYQEDAIFFFALMYSDKADNNGLVSNVAYAFFKPAEYSDEIQEILSQQRSGFLIVLVFLFFTGFLGVFICAIKLYHRHRQHLQSSPEQMIKYSK